MASTKLVPVNMLLDMEPSEFESMRDEFLHDLAQILSIEPSEIIITEVRHHCSDVHFLVPEDRAELIRLINSRDLEVPQALLKQVANWRRKYRLMLFLSGPPGFIHKTKYVPDPPKRAITWLHLSDAHFEAPTTGKKLDYWGQDKVRETLIRDLRPLLDEEHLTPDFVFFTGDVAFSGHPSEYDVALSFFAELQESIPNGSDAEFIVVPGNHDVSRSEVSQYHKEELATVKYLKKNSKVIEYVNSPKFEDTRNKVFARLDNYNKFAEDAAAFGQPEVNNGYFFTHTITRHGINIGIAGLNSAWRCSSDKDRGRLVLGVPQIDKAIDQLSQTDMRLLLMHHPP